MSDTSNNQSPRINIWWRVLLGVSLALNLLFIGLVIGAALRFGGSEGARRPPAALSTMLYRELPRSERRTFRDAMKDMPKAGWQDHGERAEELGAALRANPFDAGVLGKLLADHARTRSEWHISLQEAWMERIVAMDDSERAAYADRIENAMTHRQQYWRDREHRRRRD